MLTSEERREMIAQIAELPGLLEEAVSGLSDSQLDASYREGGWTIRQVVHHMADSHMNAYVRTRLILTEENPTLKPYDQDAWAALPDARAAGIASSLTLLRGLHDRWAILLTSQPVEAWGRKAFHPERGDVNLDSILDTYSKHGRHHVEHIKGLRGRMGW